ncbi:MULTISPECIES: type II secretion system F family protein [unclassified Nocardioides]|uniref:type II secretion system F family protein n=1 Tax=unclassified Nocardioides TaxID=2615069 RepID=UPI0009F0E3DD|nr:MULTISPECIES: type II secretion system F family protein [unclassified Nocardioides]GAW48034.1 Type II secretion system protein [Nocardioides sp. PD653-B2]GAW53663.1 Type II secretion system protein [Nocardioides sp. PD653]
MSLGLLLGCSLGAAVCLLIFALVPPRPALSSVVSRWERQRTRVAVAAAPDAGEVSTQARLGRWMATQLAQRGITLNKLRADLEITDYTLEAHLVKKLTFGLLGLIAPSIATLAVMAAGITPPLTVPLAAGLVMGGIFFWVPDLSVTQAAERRRTEFRRALATYLDLVSMSLAGGRGIPEALPTAARIGQGWAFELIRSTIERARLVGETPWAALADLGERTGMQELVDLGGALNLVADDGAKVRQSLTARAATSRRRQLAEAEGRAEKANQTMEFGQIVLFLGFLIFLGFPGVVAVMGF